ncbi:hypothetical protein HSB1_18830 [Halogranum salarium B-1]|uniref:Uncharacterized protein n=1 Tax=Halogranum salarium B-1 TaxID=1210908 RepID=J2ZGC6_9EURY|nr:hypothetical protein HSB1_18830 [Halogranum salarium B-1]
MLQHPGDFDSTSSVTPVSVGFCRFDSRYALLVDDKSSRVASSTSA